MRNFQLHDEDTETPPDASLARTMKLQDAGEAQRLAENGGVGGKIVLVS